MFRMMLTAFFLFISLGMAAAEPLQRPVARPDNLHEYTAVPTTLAGQDPKTCLAVAIYHEARGENVFGQRAVASVVLQRSEVIGRWGDDVCSVIVPVQFSFLNKDGSFEPILEMEAWRKALVTAGHLLKLGPLPHMQKADHYHTDRVFPKWRHAMIEVRQIGDHIFYRDPSSRS